MTKHLQILVAILLVSPNALAQEAEEAAADSEETEVAAEENGDGIESPKTLSGMSILGNEETPKSLVIVPWKSSEMGDELSLSDTLDDRARPSEVRLPERRRPALRVGAARRRARPPAAARAAAI